VARRSMAGSVRVVVAWDLNPQPGDRVTGARRGGAPVRGSTR